VTVTTPSPSPSSSTVVAATGNQAERNAHTSIPLWLITVPIGALILLAARTARQKSKRPSK
jgi:hypothetical protein